MCDLDRGFGFVAVGSARTFELERAVIGDVDLLIRPVDPEQAGSGRETAVVIRTSELVEIRCGNASVLRMLHDGAGVRGRNTTAVVSVEGERKPQRRSERHAALGLPPSG